ncbi:p21-activated protein kinase-interacting protein 1-like [Cyprinus carpio]|uniref:P21-activated protein kinase-interacting protein 1-like n=1 Tax=Cyprinus carpio TaxID=7962 RepID=A0A9Q9VTE7_CYPCA|nr:p21-activated protein kinase-interacting protein 1-like [Cyprinus carpio]
MHEVSTMLTNREWAIEFKLTHHAHTASLASVSSSDQFIATGSKDETIQLYDMNKKTEHGALLHHNGTRVSCLEFYGMSHLLSGGQDGLICVWSTKKWECLKSFKAHKGHVTSLSVHPSGKLVLSVGTDKTLQQNTLLAVGGDDESVRIYDVTSQKCVCEFKAHENSCYGAPKPPKVKE